MMTRRRATALSVFGMWLGVLAVIALPAPTAQAASSTGLTIRAAAAPESAKVQIVVENVANVNLGTATFDATFYVGLTCSTACRKAPWEVVNALREQQVLVAEESATSWWKVSATMVFDPDLRDYPFDSQMLPIAVESTSLTSSQLQFAPDTGGSGAALNTSVAGWLSGTPTMTTRLHDYPMLDEEYSQARFDLPIKRSLLATILTFYLPLSAFLLLGVAVLVLRRSDYHIRVAGTALVGLTIFYLATTRSVASEGVLTVWDLSLMLAYLCLALVVLSGVIGAHNYQSGRYEGPSGEALEDRIRLTSLMVVLVTLGIGAIGIPIYGLS
jgi:hypothetical protein